MSAVLPELRPSSGLFLVSQLDCLPPALVGTMLRYGGSCWYQVRLALMFCLAIHCLKRRVILGLLQLEWEKMALRKITKRRSLCGRSSNQMCEKPHSILILLRLGTVLRALLNGETGRHCTSYTKNP